MPTFGDSRPGPAPGWGVAASFLTSNAVQDVATLNWFLACRGTGHGGLACELEG